VWIERQVTPAEARALEDMKLSGIGFHKENKRVYPFGEVGCHVVGMTDLDGQGISGIERQLDAELAGADVWVCYFLDSMGRRMATPAGTKVEPRDGAPSSSRTRGRARSCRWPTGRGSIRTARRPVPFRTRRTERSRTSSSRAPSSSS
jgi:hypothetical protein